MLQLAKRWQLHRTTVAEHLQRAGILVRQRGIPAAQLDDVIGLYREGWSCQRLAEHYDCDDETIRQALRRPVIADITAYLARYGDVMAGPRDGEDEEPEYKH